MVQPQNYRRLGGWLMFIQVMSIILIVGYSLSLLASALYSFLAGFMEVAYNSLVDYSGELYGFANFFSYYQFIMIYTLIFSILSLAAVICVLVFLQKRNLKYLRISFFTGFGIAIAGTVVQIIYYAFNPLSRILEGIFSDMVYDYGYYEPFPYNLMEYWNRSIIVLFVVSLVITVGLAIAWFFYFQRSKRVAVYFDPHYVEPPTYGTPSYMASPAYPAPLAYGATTSYPAQPQPFPGYSSGYPAPPNGVYPPPSQSYNPQPPYNGNGYGNLPPQR